MIQVVFFDAVGTLIHLPVSVGEHYAKVGERFGAAMDPAAMQRAFRQAWAAAPARADSPGPRVDDDKGWWRGLVDCVLDQTLPERDRASFPRAAYFEAVYAHFAAPGVWALFPEVAGVLAALRGKGYRLGVISNFDRRLAVILENLGVRGLFESVIVSSEAGAEKPAEQIFRAALSTMRVAAEAAVHAGDEPETDGGAAALGLRVFPVDRPRVTLDALPGWLDRL